MKVTLIGIDLAKTIFQVCGVNRSGKPVFNRQLRRHQLMSWLVDYPEAVVAMEACPGSNYWGRELEARGFKVLLIPPPACEAVCKGEQDGSKRCVGDL